MKKFLPQLTPLAFLFIFISSGLASDRRPRNAFAPMRRPELQYTIPLTAPTQRAGLQKNSPAAPTATEIIWQEDFEKGLNGWTVESEYDRQIYWHRSTKEAFANTGFSYWCADSTLNGYATNWFQLLETPEFDLTGTT